MHTNTDGLVAKWRAEADRLDRGFVAGGMIIAAERRARAAELEAALSSRQGEEQPVAWYCEWFDAEIDGPCWAQYHDASDPLPQPHEWDDAPDRITPLYATPPTDAAVLAVVEALGGLLAQLKSDWDTHSVAITAAGSARIRDAQDALSHPSIAAMRGK